MNRISTTFATLLLTTACASGPGGGPSLLPRAAEQQTFDEPAAAAPTMAAADPALDLKIGGLVADRLEASTNFAEADRKLAGAIAAGAKAAPGSDAWLDAQTAIGALDAERATVLGVLTDLEQLAIARASEGLPPYPALDTAKTETDAEATRISAIVAARKASLPL